MIWFGDTVVVLLPTKRIALADVTLPPNLLTLLPPIQPLYAIHVIFQKVFKNQQFNLAAAKVYKAYIYTITHAHPFAEIGIRMSH